jgi:hypothetical protein
MRLIYVDELVKKWEAMLPIMVPDEDGKHPVSLEKVIEKLKDAPTVDAVQVTRCRQCICFRNGYCVHPLQGMISVMPGHFCGYGVGKDGE